MENEIKSKPDPFTGTLLAMAAGEQTLAAMQQWLAGPGVTASTATLSKFLTGRRDRRVQPTEPDALGDPDPAHNAPGLLAQSKMLDHAIQIMAHPKFSRQSCQPTTMMPNFVNRMSRLAALREKPCPLPNPAH